MVSATEMADFVERVIQLRRTQKEFFRTRNYTVMQKSKVLEKDIDDRADKLRAQLASDLQSAQPDLFGGEC